MAYKTRTLTCAACLNEFTKPTPATTKFCSHLCYRMFRGDGAWYNKKCEWCGKEFLARHIWAGRKDRNLAVYKEWRNAVFARDSYTCQSCGIKNSKGLGRTVQLEADHLKSWTTHPELRYDVNNGRTLCKDCHSERTAQQHKERMAHV